MDTHMLSKKQPLISFLAVIKQINLAGLLSVSKDYGAIFRNMQTKHHNY